MAEVKHKKKKQRTGPKTSVKVSMALLSYAINNEIIKPFALYILIKAKFHHSIIYNYSINRLSKIAGLHHNTTKKYVELLEKNGFVEKIDGHLLFLSQKRVLENLGLQRGNFWWKLKTRPWFHLARILDGLYYLAIVNNNRQQLFNILAFFGKNYGKINIGQRSFIKGKKQFANKKKEMNLNEVAAERRRPFHSTRQIARVLNVSHQNSAIILKRLEYYGWIKTKEDIIDVNDKKEFRSFNKLSFEEKKRWILGANIYGEGGYFYMKKGRLKLHRGIKIVFLHSDTSKSYMNWFYGKKKDTKNNKSKKKVKKKKTYDYKFANKPLDEKLKYYLQPGIKRKRERENKLKLLVK